MPRFCLWRGTGGLLTFLQICLKAMVERDDNKPTGEELIRLTARCKAAG